MREGKVVVKERKNPYTMTDGGQWGEKVLLDRKEGLFLSGD